MVFSYLQYFKRSWTLTLKNKFLWIFGFFVIILASASSNLNTTFNILKKGVSEPSWSFFSLNYLKDLFLKNSYFSNTLPVLIFFILIGLICLWLFIISQGALINGIKKNIEQQSTNFKDCFKQGWHYFWSVLGIDITFKIITVLLMPLIFIPLIYLTLLVGNILLAQIILVILFVLFLFSVIFLSLSNYYALFFLINGNKNIFQCIKKGIILFLKNWLISLEMGVFAFLLTLLAGVIFSLIGVILIFLPIILIKTILSYFALSLGINTILWWGTLIFIFLFVIIISFLNVFIYSFWFFLFKEINNQNSLKGLILDIFSRFKALNYPVNKL